MKKFLTFMLMLTAVFLFAACDGNGDGETVAVESISIQAIATTQKVGDTLTLKAIVTPDNATVKGVTWSTSDKQVATIDANKGDVAFAAPGKVTFTATSKENGNIKATTAEITVVRPELTGIEISGATKVELEGEIKLEIITQPQYAEDSVTWSIADPSIATIDATTGKVTGVALGTTTVTATSTVKGEITATYEVTVVEKGGSEAPNDIKIVGPSTCYVGYKITLNATVFPLTANQNVTWSSSNPQVLRIDEKGICLGLSEGTSRIRAYSVVDESVRSEYFTIEVKPDENHDTKFDMQGYKIVIMNASSALSEIDPFLEGYKKSDKAAKQSAWKKVEAEYNCDLSVEAYPDTAPWGNQRKNYINDAVANGAATADLYTINSAWLAGFVEADSAYDITEYYEKYGKSQMENAQREAGTIKDKIYIASTGINETANNVSLGLYYNYDKVKGLGVKDPAEMFNDGEWTYTNFEAWVKEVQAKLNSENNEYALGGHSMYYWAGLTNAAGVKITDAASTTINVDSVQSKKAMEMMVGLVNAGCVNPNADWAEGAGDADNGFQDQRNLMTTGSFGFINNENRWKDIWGEGKTNIAYVPFPYPDSVSKEDTRVAISTVEFAYMYAKGRDHAYPSGLTIEWIYKAVNEMFLNTILNQNLDPTFDAEAQLRDTLGGYLSNEESIKAAMFYDASKTFFDPTINVYDSIADNKFNSVTKQIMYQGADYQSSVEAIAGQFEEKVKELFG